MSKIASRQNTSVQSPIDLEKLRAAVANTDVLIEHLEGQLHRIAGEHRQLEALAMIATVIRSSNLKAAALVTPGGVR